MSKRLYEQMSLEVFQAPATLVSSFHKWMDTKKVPFEKGTFFNALTSFFQDFNSFKVLCNSSSPPPMYIHYVFDFGEERSQRKCQEGDKHTHSKGDSTTRSLVKNDRNFFSPTLVSLIVVQGPNKRTGWKKIVTKLFCFWSNFGKSPHFRISKSDIR